MNNKRIKIVNKKRFTIFLSIMFVAISLIVSSISKLSLAYSSNNQEYVVIEISSGDTLWEIAKRNNPYNQDTRKVVYEIMKINNMKTASIKTGSNIKIPTY